VGILKNGAEPLLAFPEMLQGDFALADVAVDADDFLGFAVGAVEEVTLGFDVQDFSIGELNTVLGEMVFFPPWLVRRGPARGAGLRGGPTF